MDVQSSVGTLCFWKKPSMPVETEQVPPPSDNAQKAVIARMGMSENDKSRAAMRQPMVSQTRLIPTMTKALQASSTSQIGARAEEGLSQSGISPIKPMAANNRQTPTPTRRALRKS